ncbi:histidine utilization repressor [Bosea sp. BK604]|uniref:histidine utilization repressor n=1 Tax=Bosea sp. BK604 TaxID=2512180 RepID=UPI001047D6FC|nr:histidine utilization repressor [Bosea sp. BK604]TCR62998.1 GntR family transcriptional regulator [Bosea sp. BK604]
MKAVSLHERILRDIEGSILSGEWPPGYRIPIEQALTERYNCSRMTVSKVLTQLTGAGLIERRRKAGSFVRQPHTQHAVLEIMDIRAEVSALGAPYRFDITARRKRRANSAERMALNLPPNAYVLDLACRHFARDTPFCLEERVISLDGVPEAEGERFETEPPGTWMKNSIPWTSAEHRIMAIAASAEGAEQLDVEQGSPCLVVERRTWRRKQGLTQVRLTYPGNAHELIARFSPSLSTE